MFPHSLTGKVYAYGHTLISQGNSWYYLYNAHGDVVKYINANGAVLQSYDYDAFGEEADPSTTDANPFRYAGQYFDDETGTYYLRARYYNPGNGRFTQQDAWGYGDPADPLSLNLYVYCINNPVKYYDPSGRWIETAFDIAGLFADALDIALDFYIGDYWALLWDVPSFIFDAAAVAIPVVPSFAATLKAPIRVGKTAKAFDKSKDTIKAGDKIGAIGKAFLRREARRFLLEQSPEFAEAVAKGITKYEVHHIIPLEWAHLMGESFDPNVLANLAGVDKTTHGLINKMWNDFRREHKDKLPTPKEIYDYAKEVYEIYGKQYIMGGK